MTTNVIRLVLRWVVAIPFVWLIAAVWLVLWAFDRDSEAEFLRSLRRGLFSLRQT